MKQYRFDNLSKDVCEFDPKLNAYIILCKYKDAGITFEMTYDEAVKKLEDFRYKK